MHDELDAGLAAAVDRYIEELFVPRDAALARGRVEASRAGLPDIAVSANEGKLLHLLARLVRPERILEIGTLGGYSTAWLARALGPRGRLLSLEIDAHHAQVARKNLARVRLSRRVEVRVGPADEALRALIAAREPPFDVVFIDADKEGYPRYLELSLRLSRPGTLLLADNTLRGGEVARKRPRDPGAAAIRAFNAQLAAHPRLDSIIVPIIRRRLDGLSVSIVKR